MIIIKLQEILSCIGKILEKSQPVPDMIQISAQHPECQRQARLRYRKIPKISPGAYIFQRLFLRGLFLEELIFGGAYLQREICVSKSIELALQLEVNLLFFLCFTLYLRAISKYTPPGGAYIWRGDLTEGFFRYEFRGLIFGGAYA